MKIFFYFGLIVSFAVLLHFSCDKNTTSIITPDPFYQNIDSSVTMIAKINNIPYYGKEYIDPFPPLIWYNTTAIEATDSLTNNRLVLSKYMVSGNAHPFIHYSYMNYSGNNYYLLTPVPYSVVLNTLSDTLIDGSFNGTFINDQNADTITIDNGIFTIRPHIPDDFFVSCSLKNTLFETQTGIEYFDREHKKFQTEYELFEDSTRVVIKFQVGSMDNNFVGSYNIWPDSRQVFASIFVGEGSSITNSSFYDYDGTMNISELITIFETDTLTGNIKEIIKVSKATFELEAINDNGETISITQGEYSYNGFNY